MQAIVIVLLALGIHFAGSTFVPGPRALFYWPFGDDSRPLIGGIGGLPKQGGSVVTPLLAGVAVLAYLAAILSLFGVLVPPEWRVALTIAGAVSSLALHALYFSRLMILPLAVDILNLVAAVAVSLP